MDSDKKTIEIWYNSNTYNLINGDKILKIVKKGEIYETFDLKCKKPLITLNYDKNTIISNNILEIYVILQKIRNVDTIQILSDLEWDYDKWNINITSEKMPDWGKILNCLLNLNNKFNKPITIDYLEEKVKLNDKRGWGGERPREIYYKLGFPFYTSKTKKNLSNSERLFECPFPICSINPTRKAILSDNFKEKRCFTCGTKEGETNCFGNICNFEKGHFDPHINGGIEISGNQCKWCNSFYKDKITWNSSTGKPTFNSYAIIRDAPKVEIIKQLKKLGFTPEDLI